MMSTGRSLSFGSGGRLGSVSQAPPGKQRIDGDAGAGQIGREDQRRRLQRGLGDAVGRVAALRQPAEAGVDVDDAAPAVRDQVRRDHMRHQERAVDVDVHRLLPDVRIGFPERQKISRRRQARAAHWPARVVDEHVQAAEAANALRQQPLAIAADGDVGLDGKSPASAGLRLDLGGNRLQQSVSGAARTTRAPACASASDIDRPSPTLAPVMATTVPSRSMLLIVSFHSMILGGP